MQPSADLPLTTRQLNHIRRTIADHKYLVGFMPLGALVAGYSLGQETAYSTRDTVAMGWLSGAAVGALLPTVIAISVLGYVFPENITELARLAGAGIGTAGLLGGIAGSCSAYLAHRRHTNPSESTPKARVERTPGRD